MKIEDSNKSTVGIGIGKYAASGYKASDVAQISPNGSVPPLFLPFLCLCDGSRQMSCIFYFKRLNVEKTWFPYFGPIWSINSPLYNFNNGVISL